MDLTAFRVIRTGLKSLKLEIPNYEYVADQFMTTHTIFHNLESMDLNVTIRTRDLGDTVYRQTNADVQFLDNNRIQINFTRAEMPKVYISR